MSYCDKCAKLEAEVTRLSAAKEEAERERNEAQAYGDALAKERAAAIDHGVDEVREWAEKCRAAESKLAQAERERDRAREALGKALEHLDSPAKDFLRRARAMAAIRDALGIRLSNPVTDELPECGFSDEAKAALKSPAPIPAQEE